MIHQGSMNILQVDIIDSKKENLKRIEIALNKIARCSGEDEYESILILEEKTKIKIEFEEIKELKGRNIWMWVVIPYNKVNLNFLEEKLSKLDLPFENYLKIIRVNKKLFINYPEKVEICRVSKEIFEILKEEHNITSNLLNCSEWEQIQNTKGWIHAQNQITRELIADKLLKNYTVCFC